MGTTSMQVVEEVLSELARMGASFAVLHGAHELEAEHVVSDLDLMVDGSITGLTRDLAASLRGRGVRLIFVWFSDLGTLNTFWWSDEVGGGCQVDLLHDPRGRNRFGFRTQAAQASVATDPWPPRLDERGRHTYLLAKRLGKGQAADLSRLRSSGVLPRRELLARRTRVGLRIASTDWAIVLNGAATNVWSRVARLPERVRHRQGVEIRLARTGNEGQLLRGLSLVLPRVRLSAGRSRGVDRLRTSLLPEVVVRLESDPDPTRVARALDSLTEFAQARIAR